MILKKVLRAQLAAQTFLQASDAQAAPERRHAARFPDGLADHVDFCVKADAHVGAHFSPLALAAAKARSVSALSSIPGAVFTPQSTQSQLSVTTSKSSSPIDLASDERSALTRCLKEAGYFASHKGGRRLTERTVGYMLKRTAKRAGIAETVSPHWLRHAHGSHALDRGATLAEVQSTLGHANVATTSGYLHARPTPRAGSNWTRAFFVEEDDDV